MFLNLILIYIRNTTWNAVFQNSACPGPNQDGEVGLSAPCGCTEKRIQDCGEGIMTMSCRCRSQAYLECQPGDHSYYTCCRRNLNNDLLFI